MERVLYHGSERVIESPVYGGGKPYNDFGRGFYCTEHAEMAAEWAVGCNHDGYVNQYRMDFDGLNVVDLETSEFSTLHWLGVLLRHRWFDVRAPFALEARDYILQTFPVDLEGVDVVEGYRADDSYFTFAQDFISGAISYRQLCSAMRLGKLGRQVMIKSERAFERLSFVEANGAPKSVWLPRRELRDRKAREQYFDYERNARQKGDIFMRDIIDEGMGAQDERLR